MKKLFISLLALMAAFSSLYAQDVAVNAGGLQPTDSLILFNVLVTNLHDYPTQGDRISFIDTKSGKNYSGVSGNDGRFQVLIPKGINVKVVANFLGKDSVQRTIAVPDTKERGTINYQLKYRLPSVVELKDVYFDFDKATLKQESYKSLYNLVLFLKSKPSITVEVGGYTDNKGSADYNIRLSQARCESVVNYLVHQGVNRNRLVPKGYGMQNPVDTNDTDEGRAHNRRTEVRILSGDTGD